MERTEKLQQLRRVVAEEGQAIVSLSETTDSEQWLSVADAIERCTGKIVLTGCGTSAMAAKKISHSLCCIERPAQFLSPADAVHGGLGAVQKDDVLVLISKGGNTDELLALIPACKDKGALLVGVTENSASEVAKQADITLIVRVEKEPCSLNMLATSSTLAVIAVFDAICILLMETMGYTRALFARIHPGGAVGERLLKGLE